MESRELLDIAAWNINKVNEYNNWINYLQERYFEDNSYICALWNENRSALGGIRTHNPAYLSNYLYVQFCFFSNRENNSQAN